MSQGFPPTRHSIVIGTHAEDEAAREVAWEALITTYWRPVYTYLRVHWRADEADAQDWTQEFFTRALEKGFFASYDPAVARFRTFLRVCLDRLVANELKARGRLKRGGGAEVLSLDYAGAEGELRKLQIPDDRDPETLFQTEWVRSLFGLAVDTLRGECGGAGKEVHFALFQRYDLDDLEGDARPTYASLAEEFGIKTTDVTNYLFSVRRRFRAIVLDRLREVTGNEQEFREEARALLGVDIPEEGG